MRKTKKLTLSAMMIAMGVLFMTLGYFVEALDLTVAALLSLVMVFMHIEVGSPYTFMVWLGTSLLGAVFFTGGTVWLTYILVFGIYPVLKDYIERLPRWSQILLKLAYFNVALTLLILATELILGIPFVSLGEEYIQYKRLVMIGLAVAFNIAFIVYDIFIKLAARTYMLRLRARFARLLK